MHEMVQILDKLLDDVNESQILDKMADTYAIFAKKLEERGFSRAEIIEIISRQGAFKANG